MRLRGEYSTRRVWLDGVELDPAWSQAVTNHSPDGFNWGYAGSGPAQLALAVLLGAGWSEHDASVSYQTFKWEVLLDLPQCADFEIDVEWQRLDCVEGEWVGGKWLVTKINMGGGP